ncbi:MAG: metallophosphoesterase, partial [Patescibacteria group bacterium]
MNLRKSHDMSRGFDVFFAMIAGVGTAAALVGFSRGGAWTIFALAAVAGEILIVYGIWIEPRRLVVTRLREPLVAEPSVWITIAFLSDLHAGAFRRRSWYERIAREVEALHPDILILGGDYVVDRAEPIHDLAALAPLTARHGKYFVLGNHDYMDSPQEIRRAIAAWGYEDLTNRVVTIRAEGRTLELQGIDDMWYGIPKRFARSSRLIPHILVSHEPDALLDLTEGDTDLVLIGHTHGGQIRLPLVGALWPIPTQLGRAVDHGRKIVNG